MPQSTLRAVEALVSFSRGIGRTLCIKNGFETFSMSVGVNVGKASIIADALRVRAAGQTVIEAKRLQEAAGKGEVLVHTQVANLASSMPFHFSEERPILIKKNLIKARKLTVAVGRAA